MPEKKHLRGVNAKGQREYEHIKESAERSGRYGNRAREVAARTVLKQYKAKDHSKGLTSQSVPRRQAPSFGNTVFDVLFGGWGTSTLAIRGKEPGCRPHVDGRHFGGEDLGGG